MTGPDFEKLKAEHNEAVRHRKRELAKKFGGKPTSLTSGLYGPDMCYCDCINGGPCQHEFENDHQGNPYCRLCGQSGEKHRRLRLGPFRNPDDS